MMTIIFERSAPIESHRGEDLRKEAEYHSLPIATVEHMIAILDWRQERQALPEGSVPLAMGKEVICGEYFTEKEILVFKARIDGDNDPWPCESLFGLEI